MRKLPELWRSLDRIAGQLAIPATWALEAGDDFEFLRPHLGPTDMVGALYPCPHRSGNCPRKIVDYDDGEFAAICRDHHLSCERVPLTAKEALVHDLDLPAFLQPILRALGIKLEEPQKRGFATWSVGLSARRSSMNQPAFLIIAHRTEIFESAVNDLLLDVTGQFLVMAPTNEYRSVQAQSRMQARNIAYICLEEQVSVDDRGAFVAIDPVDSADRTPTTPIPQRHAVVEKFKTDFDCTDQVIYQDASVHRSDFYKWVSGGLADKSSKSRRIEETLRSNPRLRTRR
jgi:hypothetical protein